MIHLAGGIAIRDGRVLVVASHYPNHPQPLWNLPGGRQQPGELLTETVAREFLEETGLLVDVGELAYVSESYDGEQHYLSATFHVMLRQAQHDSESATHDSGSATHEVGTPSGADADHVVALEWVPIEELPQRIVVGVVREPLVAYLRGALPQRYAGVHDAGVTIEWPADSR